MENQYCIYQKQIPVSYTHLIKSSISAINIDTDKLINEGIDFIISTVELDVDYKHICLNPMFLQKDKIKLKEFIHRYSKMCIRDRIKEIAKYITDSNNNDGVAKAIYKSLEV